MLPIYGLKYYLKHKESGKYVHPFGGSDNPGNDTPLVYHSDGPRLALQFIFEKSNGYTQIKQYSSNKYIHPGGGQANNDTPLVLYDGNDNARTSLSMIKRDGRTFLQHSNGKYVHPSGGSSDPGNDTKLVYHQDWRPSLSIELEPVAEDIKMIKLELDDAQLQNCPEDSVAASTTIANNSDSDQNMSLTVEYTQSLTNSFTFSFTEEIGFSSTTKIEGSVPLVGGASTEITFSTNFSSTQEKSTSKTSGVKTSVTLNPKVKAKSSLKCTVTTQRKKGKVPFTMTFKTPSGVEFERKGSMHIEYYFDQKIGYD